MLKYFQTKMFLIGNILIKDQFKFGDFWMYLSILNNTTKLQKNRKRKQKGKTYLAPTNRPTCRPSPAAAPASCLARQAGRQVFDGGTSARHAAARRPASPPRRPAAMDDLHVAP